MQKKIKIKRLDNRVYILLLCCGRYWAKLKVNVTSQSIRHEVFELLLVDKDT